MPQEQAVGELLVDDADIAGDDDGTLLTGPLLQAVPDPRQAVLAGGDHKATVGAERRRQYPALVFQLQ